MLLRCDRTVLAEGLAIGGAVAGTCWWWLARRAVLLLLLHLALWLRAVVWLCVCPSLGARVSLCARVCDCVIGVCVGRIAWVSQLGVAAQCVICVMQTRRRLLAWLPHRLWRLDPTPPHATRLHASTHAPPAAYACHGLTVACGAVVITDVVGMPVPGQRPHVGRRIAARIIRGAMGAAQQQGVSADVPGQRVHGQVLRQPHRHADAHAQHPPRCGAVADTSHHSGPSVRRGA